MLLTKQKYVILEWASITRKNLVSLNCVYIVMNFLGGFVGELAFVITQVCEN